MAKKGVFILVLMLVIMGSAFAQTDIETMPKNTITVDLGPTIVASAKTKLFSFSVEGGKLAWRINTDRHGRFTIEPSLRYNGGIGHGNTIGQKITEDIAGDVKSLGEAFAKLKEFLFSGGPRFCIAFDWRF
jgi:nanoRNase/pAp phosphatase (c-di-AMP/oligoRNAs hydrolase)